MTIQGSHRRFATFIANDRADCPQPMGRGKDSPVFGGYGAVRLCGREPADAGPNIGAGALERFRDILTHLTVHQGPVGRRGLPVDAGHRPKTATPPRGLGGRSNDPGH